MDRTKEMIGTFSPQQEPYTHEMHEETTPSGMFARGSYTAKTKVIYFYFYVVAGYPTYTYKAQMCNIKCQTVLLILINGGVP